MVRPLIIPADDVSVPAYIKKKQTAPATASIDPTAAAESTPEDEPSQVLRWHTAWGRAKAPQKQKPPEQFRLGSCRLFRR
jgi:hypothetical protein